MDEADPDAEQLARDEANRPGTLLRQAREKRGMSIGDVAELTRIAKRQLEAIERSDFAALPGTPYAVGFARAYARAVGADEIAVARGVREELGVMEAGHRHEMFEPVDPARVPPRRLAWVAAAAALVLAIAYAVWRTQFFAVSTDQEVSDLANRASEASRGVAPEGTVPAAAPSALAEAVVLTAREDVWLRIYDQSGTRLLERETQKGESYTGPAQANNPMILTGRPDALAVTVGGKALPPLGPPDRTIADVPISAAALLARTPPSAPSAATTPPAQGGGAAAGAPTRPEPLLQQPAVPATATMRRALLAPSSIAVSPDRGSVAASLVPTGDANSPQAGD